MAQVQTIMSVGRTTMFGVYLKVRTIKSSRSIDPVRHIATLFVLVDAYACVGTIVIAAGATGWSKAGDNKLGSIAAAAGTAFLLRGGMQI